MPQCKGMDLTADMEKNPADALAPAALREETAVTAGNAAGVSADADQKNTPRPHLKMLGIPLPESMENGVYALKDWGAHWRKGAIEKTPAAIVNHSSNVIGAMQIVGEAFMFEASGTKMLKPENKGKLLHYLIDPPQQIMVGVKGNLSKSKINLGETLLSASTYQNLPQKSIDAFKALTSFEVATQRDRIGRAGEMIALKNKWSARSGLMGLTAMTVATLLPDKKDTAAETDAMTEKAKENPLSYVGMRVYQALNPIEWWSHKRQFAGLGMTMTGVLSAVSSFRQVAGKEIGHQHYMFNKWQMIGGLITAAGGSQLMLAVDNDSGWRNFGMTQMLRLTTLPPSIRQRFEGTKGMQEQGAIPYLIGQGVFQVKNMVAASIGGAEKDADGKAVDHSAMRVEAKHTAAEHHKDKLAHKGRSHLALVTEDGAPHTTISAATGVERAMPERVKAQQEKQEVAVG